MPRIQFRERLLIMGLGSALLIGLLLFLLPERLAAGRKVHSHLSEKISGGKSYQLLSSSTAGRNGTISKGTHMGGVSTPPGSRASQAEIRELLSVAAREFEAWKDGITLEMVERLYCVPESADTMRIQIINGKPFLVGPNFSWQSRFRTMQKQILNVASQYDLPDVDFIMSTSDSCQDWSQLPMSKDGNFSRCERNAPLFSFCRHKYQSACVMMPDFSFGGWPEAFMDEWRSSRSWMMMAAERTPFSKRKNKLFWRGGGTNEQRVIMDYSGIVQDAPVTDVHLMHWGGGHDDPQFKEEFVSLPEHCRYKQLLHLGGVSYSARLRYLLLCKAAVVFPYDYDWEPKEFWYHMFKDRVNIMLTGKVDDNNWGGNVVDVAQELSGNDTLAEEIGKAGHHLAAEILHPDNIDKYWVELLTQYNKLMTFKPKIHADATPLEVAIMQAERGRLSSERTCTVC